MLFQLPPLLLVLFKHFSRQKLTSRLTSCFCACMQFTGVLVLSDGWLVLRFTRYMGHTVTVHENPGCNITVLLTS
jgi:hypothetical protein